MGMFDTVKTYDKEGQVKLWDCTLKTYEVGDQVPELLNGPSNYSVAMREGGYINIVQNHLQGWTDYPVFTRVVDKYGNIFDPSKFEGLVPGEKYNYFDKEENANR